MLRPYARGVACIQVDDSQGSGFVVRNTAAGEGYLLTTAHVLGVNPTNVSVQLNNVDYSAEVLRIHADRDLAMLRICCGEFVVLKRNNRLGHAAEWVEALGFQDGVFITSDGLLRGLIHRGLNAYLEYTADVRPGGSGGPLMALPHNALRRHVEGEGFGLKDWESLGVLGIVSTKSLEYEFTTYAIHQTDASQFVDRVWSDLGLEGTPSSTTPQHTPDW